MDNQNLVKVPFHGSFKERFSRGAPLVMTTKYKCLPLLSSLLLPLVPMSALFEGDLPLGDYSLSLFPPFDIFGQSAPIDQPFNYILQLDAVVCLVVVTFMKTAILRLNNTRRLSNRVRGWNPHFQNFVLTQSL